jgi:hypothetical protein
VDAPPADPPRFRRWLPAPDAADGSDPADEAGERRPATRIEFEYADWGPVFGVDLVRRDR